METLDSYLFIVMFVFVLWYWRYTVSKNNKLKFKYELFALRDKIRLFQIENYENDDHQWFLNYLDESICITIAKSNSLNFYSVILLNFIYRKNKKLDKFKIKFDTEISQNEMYKSFNDEYVKILATYIIRKHFTLRQFLKIFIFIRSSLFER